MSKTSDRFVRWAGRIAGIALAVWLGVFSLDSKSVPEFLIHNIPSVIVLAAVVVGWRWPGLGALAFAVLTVPTFTFFHTYRRWETVVFISGPFVLVALLFLAQWLRAKVARRATGGEGQAPVSQ